MKIRYKETRQEAWANQFNTSTVGEVLTGDDSALIKELDVFIRGEWIDMNQAFKNKDIIPDNYNEWFAEPKTDADKDRGYFL